MSFRTNTVDLHGPAGAEWLARIPDLIAHCAAEWALSFGDEYAQSSFSFIVRAQRSDGTPAALKLSFPGEQADREADCLRAFGGRGAVALLEYDPGAGALLLQRAEPGHQLAELCGSDDLRAMAIAAEVMRTLWRPLSAFPTVDTWPGDMQRIARMIELDEVMAALASDAQAIAAELTSSSIERVLLHGDLHQFNILAAGEAWLAIDPVGVIGERACEIAPLVLNPMALLRRSDLSTLIRRRITQLSDELGLDLRRATAWTFVRAVLAILWSLEDHGRAAAEWVEAAKVLRGQV